MMSLLIGGVKLIPRYIRIAGITKEDRHQIIDFTVNCINSCSGWLNICNNKFFSYKMTFITSKCMIELSYTYLNIN